MKPKTMKRTMRCCSCGFEEELELPEDTTLEQMLKIGNEWRLFKHQPNCNSDPIKDGTFPTTMIIQTEGKLDPLCQLLLPCNFCRAEIVCQYKIDKSKEDLPAGAVSLEDEDQAQAQDQERLKKELMLKRFHEAKIEEMGDKDFRRFINSLHEDLDLEDQDLERLSKHLNEVKKVDAATKFIEDQKEI